MGRFSACRAATTGPHGPLRPKLGLAYSPERGRTRPRRRRMRQPGRAGSIGGEAPRGGHQKQEGPLGVLFCRIGTMAAHPTRPRCRRTRQRRKRRGGAAPATGIGEHLHRGVHGWVMHGWAKAFGRNTKRGAPIGGAYWAVVEQGMVAVKNSILAGLMRLRKVGELEEHQSACVDPRGSSMIDGRWRSGLSPTSSKNDSNGVGRVFARGKERKKATTPWSSYSTGVGMGSRQP
jgi:hypothetical protein